MMEKKYLMIDGYMLNKVLGNPKEIIGIKRFDDTKILIDTDEKLPDDISLKNVVIPMTCVIKDDSKFYPQTIFEEALFVK